MKTVDFGYEKVSPEEKTARVRGVFDDLQAVTRSQRAQRPALLVPGGLELAAEEVGQALAEGALLGAYRFDRYQKKPEDEEGPLRSLSLHGERAAEVGASVHTASTAGIGTTVVVRWPGSPTPDGLTSQRATTDVSALAPVATL